VGEAGACDTPRRRGARLTVAETAAAAHHGRVTALRHDLKAQTVPVADLVPWGRNPRNNDAAAERLAYTIQTHGWTTPLLVQAGSNRIIGGHTRLKAALRLGLTDVPAVFLDVDDRQADAIAIADNRLGELAEWDADELGALLRELADDGADMAAIGYDDAELADLLAALDDDPPPPPADDDVPDVQEGPPDSVLGGVYELGQHRLVCGDCTDAAVWDALGLGGPVAIVTDPPYGQAQSGVPGDGEADHAPLMRGWSAAATVTDAAIVVFQSTKRFPPMLDAGRDAGWSFEAMLWLYKSAQIAFPWRGWIRKSEAVLVFSVGEPDWSDHHPYSHDTYTVASVRGELPDDIGWHGSVKPVAVVADIVCRVVRASGQVVDPFAGSGTTLMACAQEGRVARCIELDPKYCDVIRRRWTRYAVEHGIDPGSGALA
jgi:hypothetical protein